MAKLVVIFVISMIVNGCATTGRIVIEDLQMSLVDLQQAVIANLPLGQRQLSSNGREYTSQYFIMKQGEFAEAVGTSSRNFAVISILGDRRPYKIEVVVTIESRDASGQYRVVKYDQGMARVISRRLEKALHKRREDRNIIDDFRVF